MAFSNLLIVTDAEFKNANGESIFRRFYSFRYFLKFRDDNPQLKLVGHHEYSVFL